LKYLVLPLQLALQDILLKLEGVRLVPTILTLIQSRHQLQFLLLEILKDYFITLCLLILLNFLLQLVPLVLQPASQAPGEFVAVDLLLEVYEFLARLIRQLAQIHLIIFLKLLFIKTLKIICRIRKLVLLSFTSMLMLAYLFLAFTEMFRHSLFFAERGYRNIIRFYIFLR